MENRLKLALWSHAAKAHAVREKNMLPPITYSEADSRAVSEIVTKSGTSFAKGMHILSPVRRQAMYGLYAFCREVDDIADEDAPSEKKVEALQKWRERVGFLFANKTENSLDRVLVYAINAFNLRKEDFIAIIDGMQMDAQSVIVAPDEKTFDLYCDRVASAVGRLSVRIFGDGSAYADEVAFHLGRALQITNILRDLAEDAGRGRLYLPLELLERYSLELDPQKVLHAPQLQDVCNVMAARAEDHFRKAQAAMVLCNKKAMKPARLMEMAYKAILRAQRKAGWHFPLTRVSISPVQKLGIALKSLAI